MFITSIYAMIFIRMYSPGISGGLAHFGFSLRNHIRIYKNPRKTDDPLMPQKRKASSG